VRKLTVAVYCVLFRSEQAATLQGYRRKLEHNLNVYKSKLLAVELARQQDITAELSSQLQEAIAQRDDLQRQLSERRRAGIARFSL